MIRKTNLIPLAVLISIVGVILVPLSRYGGVYAWHCGRIAVSVCFFYIGCICAGWLKNKLNYKWLVTIGVAAAICFGQKYLFESTPHYPIYDHIYWFSRSDLLKKLGCDNDEILIFSQGQIKEDFIGIEHDIVDMPSNNQSITTLQFYKKPLDLDKKFTLKA